MTHFLNGEADFATIPDFMRDVNNFRKMKEIKFFDQCRLWKSFFLWRRCMRKSKMAEREESLSKSLFITDFDLCPSLIKIRELYIKLSNTDCFPVILI